MKSDIVKKGIERAPHRSLFKAIGYTDAEIRRPLIGIANSENTIIPGHVHLDKIVEAVKAGVYMAGGTPIEFGTIGVCDGIAMNHEGMKYGNKQKTCRTLLREKKNQWKMLIETIKNQNKTVETKQKWATCCC